MLMFLVNMKDQGLSLLAIHRVLHGLPTERVERLLKDLPQYFHIRADIHDLANLQERMQEVAKTQPALGLYTHKGDYWLLNPKSEGLPRAAARSNLRALSIPLDVNLLDRLILEDLLDLKAGAADRETHLLYIKDAREGVEKVKQGEAHMAFFLNPVMIEVVQDLAREGIKMPHKSTYFYPKPLSGLVMNAL